MMMPDRNEVITHLEIMHTWAAFALEKDLDFFEPAHMEQMAKWTMDAIDLLKEQEPVIPILRPSIKGLAWHCGSCDWKMIEVPDTVTYEATKGAISYCANCGKAVKWDA